MRNISFSSQNFSKGKIARFAFAPQLHLSFETSKTGQQMLRAAVATLMVMMKLAPADALATAQQKGLWAMLALARHEAKWQWQYIPQLTMLVGLHLLFLTLILTLATATAKLLLGVAHANPMPGTIAPNDLLRQFFDIGGNNPESPMVVALGSMLQIYSAVMLVLAGIMLFYIIIKVAAETAQSGVPFGRGFAYVWGPVRLMFAFLLLIPMGNAGLNLAQYGLVKVAEMGSDMATSAFRSLVGIEPDGSTSPRFNNWVAAAVPATVLDPGANQHFENMVTMELCRAAYQQLYRQNGSNLGMREIVTPLDITSTAYGSMANQQMQQEMTARRITYQFPDRDCGSIDVTDMVAGRSPSNATQYIAVAETTAWQQMRPQIRAFSEDLVRREMGQSSILPTTLNMSELRQRYIGQYDSLRSQYGELRSQARSDAQRTHLVFMRSELQQDIREQGWIVAATWLHTFARLNGEAAEAFASSPASDVSKLRSSLMGPSARATESSLVAVMGSLFNPAAANMVSPDMVNAAYLPSMEQVTTGMPTSNPIPGTGMELRGQPAEILFLRVFHAFFGEPSNNPLAQIQSFGRWMFATGSQLLSAGFMTQVGGGVVNLFLPTISLDGLTNSIGGFLATIGMFMLSLGFTAGFLLPMVPLTRFVIGILGWLLLVFEAVLAAPLVALAHMRVDGEGLPGQMAQQAYILGLSLFLRPFLMIAGLFIGLIITNAMLTFVNFIFVPTVFGAASSPVSSNALTLLISPNTVMGGALGGAIAYLTIYVFLCFTLVNAAFKAIDILPNSVMRWIGSNLTSSINDSHEVSRESRQQFGAIVATGGAMPGAFKMPGNPKPNLRPTPGAATTSTANPASPNMAAAAQTAPSAPSVAGSVGSGGKVT